ncbi:unnamed protein product, partial [Mesorhabditis belari]|uniref:Raf homolog serine/threonine-protein kinase n=1 Tax=Mesorhabditis belari TaxID=2138241 RepID=A0AAF3FFA9_9BILA
MSSPPGPGGISGNVRHQSPLLSPCSPQTGLPIQQLFSGTSTATASPILSPRRLTNTLLMVHLPFGLHSKVEVRTGETARDAISRVLRKRCIQPSFCHVSSSPNPRDERLDLQEEMESIASRLPKKELWVHSEYLDTISRIEHTFQRKTFIPPQTCDACKRQMWIAYRCEYCNVKFHQRCSSKIPIYCDLLQRGGEEIFNKLRILCTNSNNGQLAEEILTKFVEPTSPSVQVPQHSPGEREIQRKRAVKRTQAPNVASIVSPANPSLPTVPYPRDRSSSAPNINAINEENASFETERIMADLEKRDDVKIPSSSRIQTGAQRRLGNRLQAMGGSPCSSTSPSSTCSSPPAHSLHPSHLFPNAMPLTPPQSAPPQKVSIHFFRGRSKSPGDKLDVISILGRPKSKKVLEEWEIDESQVTLHCKVGSGSFGTVFRAEYFGLVALKRLNVAEPNLSQLQAFKNEVALLKKTRHPNILNFMGWIREPQLAIVTQWCEGSSLYKHIHCIEPRKEFELQTVLDIFKQVALGMNFLHSKRIIHRDLKSNNIFLTDDSTIKIGDFGLATVKTRWSGTQQNQQPTGSILWMAPEVIRMQDQNPYTNKSDIYSFGVVMYEVLSGQLPYTNINNRDQILFMVGHGFLRPDPSRIRPDCTRALRELFERCIKLNRDDRPEFGELSNSLKDIALPKLSCSTSMPNLHFGGGGNSSDLSIHGRDDYALHRFNDTHALNTTHIGHMV